MAISSGVTWFIRDLYKKIEILEEKLELKIESSVNKFKTNNNQYVDKNIDTLEKVYKIMWGYSMRKIKVG